MVALPVHLVGTENPCTRVFRSGVSRARYFNPGTGRLWTMDTAEGDQEDPLSLHKYLYCQADPVNYTDASGKAAVMKVIFADKTSDYKFSAHLSDLVKELQSAKYSGVLIDQLYLKGHGEKKAFFMVGGGRLSPSTYGWGSAEYFEVRPNNHIMTQSNDDLTQDFLDAVGSGSLIVLDGCETGRGDDNIAQKMSVVLPNVTVVGGSGWAQFGGVVGSSHALGAKNYYVNGKKANHTRLFSGGDYRLRLIGSHLCFS